MSDGKARDSKIKDNKMKDNKMKDNKMKDIKMKNNFAKTSDAELAEVAGRLIEAEDGLAFALLRRQGLTEDIDEERLRAMRRAAMEALPPEPGPGRRALVWLGNYAATAAVLLLLLVVSSSATALALGREATVGCPMPARESETIELRRVLAEYGIDKWVAPKFLPGEYEAARVEVYEEEELRVFTGVYLDRSLPEHMAEGNRLPLYIVIRQHLNVDNWATAPDLTVADGGCDVERLVVAGLTYYIGESRGVHWLAWKQSEFECVIVGYFSAEDARWLAYQMNGNMNDNMIDDLHDDEADNEADNEAEDSEKEDSEV